MKHVLITGATSGLGLGLAKHYLAQGWRVSVVNRHALSPERTTDLWEYRLDVRDHDGVLKLVQGLRVRRDFPDLWILSAGINRPDSRDGKIVDFEAYHEVWQTNFNGVMIFVKAIWMHAPPEQRLQLVCASSTSNIVGNPTCAAYNESKLGIHHLFREMDKPGKIRYRSLVLGPVATNIFTSSAPSPLQKRVRDWLTVRVEDAVPVIARFLEGNRQALYYPKKAVWAMRALKVALKVAPGLYR